MSAADTLQKVYAQRAAAIAQQRALGDNVIGIFGSGYPTELILATGYTPIAIAPTPGPATPHADRYFDPGFDPLLRQAFEKHVDGSLAPLRLAIHISHFEGNALLYYSVKEVLKRGEGQNLPPLQLHVNLGEPTAAAHDYNLHEMRGLASRLKVGSGIDPTPDALAAATQLTNRIRAAGAQLLALRRAGRLPAVEALRAIGAGRFLEPARYLELLEAYVQEHAAAPAQKLPRVLLISTLPLYFDDLHAAIAAGGAQVVAEDDAWGARAFGPPLQLGNDPLESLSRYYGDNTPNRGQHPHTRRLKWIYDTALSSDIDAVLVYMPRSDQFLGWDYPRLRSFFEAHDKPHVVLDDEIFAADGAGRITAATSAFLARL